MAEAQGKPHEDWLRLAYSAFSESTSYFDSGIRSEIEGDIRHFQSRHLASSKYESPLWSKKSAIFRPKTRSAIRRAEAKAAAALFSNSDVTSIDPEDQDNKVQVAGSKVLHSLVNRRLTHDIKWFLISLGAYQDAKAVGVCISHQSWVYNEKRGIDRPQVELVPIENFRFSPGASWHDVIGTSPYLVEIIPMYVKDVKSRMRPVADGVDPRWISLSEQEILAAAQKTSDTIRLARDPGRQDAKTQPSDINDFSIVYVHRNIIERDDEDYIFYTLGTEHVLSKPVKLKEVYLHGERPYTMGFAVLEAHRIYPSGDARLVRELQKEVNEVANVRMDNWKLAVSKRWFARRGAQVDTTSLTRGIAGSVTLVGDIEKDVKEVEFKDVTASAYKEQDVLNLDFDELSGNFSMSSIESNRKLSETVGGLEMLSGDANEVGLYGLRTWTETWLKPTIRQIALLEQFYETDENLLRLAGKSSGMLDEGVEEINAALMMVPIQVSVHVGIGATSPTARLNQLLFLLTKLKEILEDGVLTKAGLDIEEVVRESFGKMGYDSGARFFQWGEKDPQVMLLEQQISDLQDALKRKDAPEVVAAKVELLRAQAEKVKAEKVKVGVESTFGAMQAAEVVAAVPAVAPVADVIMRAAGYVEPTPPGIDPGFAPGDQAPGQAVAPVQAAAGLTVQPVTNKRTGVGFTPGGATDRELPGDVPRNTNPLTPKPLSSPASPMVGENAGIETMRSDTKGPNQ